MSKKAPLAACLTLLAAWCGAAFAADPSASQIRQVAASGNLPEAQQMVAQVLRDHPRSGKAHWVAAELDARAGHYGQARTELRTAQSLAPGLPFANPAAVRTLERQLGMPPGQAAGPAARAAHSSRLALLLILIAVAIVVWLILRRRAALMGYPQYPGSASPGGYGAGAYPGGYMPGTGPGLMGNIASGVALGAGVAAGEAMVHHALDPGRAGGPLPHAEAGPAAANADMGGDDFGVSDPGSWDDGGTGGFDEGGAGGGDDGGWS